MNHLDTMTIENLIDTREWKDKNGNYARSRKCVMRKKLRTYIKNDNTTMESLMYDEVIRLRNIIREHNIKDIKETSINIQDNKVIEKHNSKE